MTETDPDETPADSSSHSATPPRELRSEELFGGRHEVLIVHAGETYRLRTTRNGKLILHK